jgi:hypothetical protein
VDDTQISVRFKHGIHTIYLFVDALAPFADVTKELLELLRDRYPAGLTTSTSPPLETKIPAGDAKIIYGVLKSPRDPLRGWKTLEIGDGSTYTPSKCGLENNSIVAFAFPDHEGEAEFEVEWPREWEEEEEA